MTLRIKVDYTKQLSEEPNVGHNRWHPNIQPILEVEPSEEVGIETRDAFDGQLSSASTSDDIPSLDLNLVHPLTGPVYVKGAQPGDLLQIDILEVTTGDWGYTIQVPGFGFFHRPTARWRGLADRHRDQRHHAIYRQSWDRSRA